jgi:hypothetical protein
MNRFPRPVWTFGFVLLVTWLLVLGASLGLWLSLWLTN